MGNKPDAFLQCSPAYLLNHALNNVHNREQLKMLLPRKVVLITFLIVHDYGHY